MNENPYQAPQARSDVVGVLSGTREDLRSVAKFQKGILVCLLIYLVIVFGQFAIPPEIRIVLLIGLLLNVIAGAVFVFRLAIKVYGTGLGILLGILSMVPLIGLLVLLRVNGRATEILRENGIKVGLLGARLSTINQQHSPGD